MITNSEAQLKDLIKNKAEKNKIPITACLQTYLLECLLNRISHSPYKNKFIIKGGLLVSSFIGIDSRTTMDMDATIEGLPLDSIFIKKVFSEICEIKVDDDFLFSISRIEQIREKDEYQGIRVHLVADYKHMHLSLYVDVTAGDIITPKAITHSFSRLLDNDEIQCKSYPLETLLAEKIETILSRSITNTRPRDFYDIYVLTTLYPEKISYKLLRKALNRTSEHRQSKMLLDSYKIIITTIKDDDVQKNYWQIYQKKFPYAANISFDSVCDTVFRLMGKIMSEE